MKKLLTTMAISFLLVGCVKPGIESDNKVPDWTVVENEVGRFGYTYGGDSPSGDFATYKEAESGMVRFKAFMESPLPRKPEHQWKPADKTEARLKALESAGEKCQGEHLKLDTNENGLAVMLLNLEEKLNKKQDKPAYYDQIIATNITTTTCLTNPYISQ